MCSIRKVGISPCWISFGRRCCIKRPYPRVWRGKAKPRSHSPDSWLLLLTLPLPLLLLMLMVVVHPQPSMQELPLGCMIGRRAGTV